MEDLLQYCKYYHGEEKCPYKDITNENIFWNIEKQYFENASHSNSFHKGWVKSAKMDNNWSYVKKSLLASNKISIESKAIILYIETMLSKWMPYEPELILYY